MPGQAFQYLCSDCGTILKETFQRIDVGSVREECPHCGSQLAESLTLKKAVQKTEPPKLVAASDFVLSFGVRELDSLLHLELGDRLCLVGGDADRLLTRLCVRSMVSRRDPYSKVVAIDAGNRSDPYLAVNCARQLGLDYRRVLQNFVVSRAFTIHQLAGAIVDELPALMDKHGPKIVMINDLTHMFTSDPQVNPKEGERLVGEMMDAIEGLPKGILVAISMREAGKEYQDIVMPSCNKRMVSNS